MKTLKIVEKDYEILTYKNFITGNVYSIGQVFLSNDGYREFNTNDINAINWKGKKTYSIHSVKRLSDGEIFTVGDKYQVLKPIKEIRTIDYFRLSDNTLFIQPVEFGYSLLPDINKVKEDAGTK